MPNYKLVQIGILRALKVFLAFTLLEVVSISVMHLVNGDFGRLDAAFWVRTLGAACGYSFVIAVLAFIYYVWIDKRRV